VNNSSRDDVLEDLEIYPCSALRCNDPLFFFFLVGCACLGGVVWVCCRSVFGGPGYFSFCVAVLWCKVWALGPGLFSPCRCGWVYFFFFLSSYVVGGWCGVCFFCFVLGFFVSPLGFGFLFFLGGVLCSFLFFSCLLGKQVSFFLLLCGVGGVLCCFLCSGIEFAAGPGPPPSPDPIRNNRGLLAPNSLSLNHLTSFPILVPLTMFFPVWTPLVFWASLA